MNGLFLVGASLLALVGVLATRGEPRLAKELQALNAIIKDMPKGEERSALKERRSRLALNFARRGQIALADLVMYVIFGGLLLMYVPLSISQMLGREPEQVFTQVVLFVMLVVFTIGAVAFLLGVAAGLIIGISALIRWVRGRRGLNANPAEGSPAASSSHP
ncbi:hypothetical protein [Microbacterium sp. LWH3-1.2]|uniref:hypothetical protein n=1 Tax=Microbacterium sp. LWH3-1.2 TaxID=3135256 RepID=UPI00341B4FB9